MENENTFNLFTDDRYGYDVSVWDHKGKVWLNLDANSNTNDDVSQPLTAAQARELAAALLRFADRA